MLKPEYLARLPSSMVEMYSQVEIDILEDMARRISTYNYWIPAAEHQAKILEEAGMVRADMLSMLSGLTTKSERELKQLMQEAGGVALKSDDAIYKRAGLSPAPLGASVGLQKILNSGYRKTRGEFKNLTKTTAVTGGRQFEEALDRAYMQITFGGFDYNTAIRNAVKGLSRDGLGSITYPTGKVDSLEAAVRRAVITGVNQTALELQEARAEEMGCDLVETSAHAGARPEHAAWQGQVFSRSGTHKKYRSLREATGYGTGAGLGGWNCSHGFSPYFEGSSLTYSKEQLKAYAEETVTYNGKELTLYEAAQEQRGIERGIRRWKREQGVLRGAGLPTEQASVKIKQWQAREKDFLEQTGMKKQVGRSQVGTYGKKEARRTTAEVEKHYKAWIGSISNEGTPKNIAEYYGMKYNNPKEYAQLMSYAKKVDSGMISSLCGFENFKKQYENIENQVIGLVTANGITITQQSDHFIERVIGTMADPQHKNVIRSGVAVEDIVDALKNGKVKPVKYTPNRGTGGVSPSQVFYTDKCTVTVNPENGNLIQCNP